MALTLVSNDFQDGDYLSVMHVLSEGYGFGCAGGNRSPHLAWSGAPEGTKGFALTCFDPDAPTGSGFWHWLVVDIPLEVSELPAGTGDRVAGEVFGVQTRTDFGQSGYGGPCPPKGDHPHRYIFTIHALLDRLGLPADTMPAVIGFNLHFKTLEKASLMGLYRH